MSAEDGKREKNLYLVQKYMFTTRYRKLSIQQTFVFRIDPKDGKTEGAEEETAGPQHRATGPKMHSRQHGLSDDCMSAFSYFFIGIAHNFFSFIFSQPPGGRGWGWPSLPRCRDGGARCVPPIWPLENFMGIRPFFCMPGWRNR